MKRVGRLLPTQSTGKTEASLGLNARERGNGINHNNDNNTIAAIKIVTVPISTKGQALVLIVPFIPTLLLLLLQS